ncbi:hypothetical protein ACP70R_012470 [Stipagrostis hirtigluma subsp. patula]
MDAVSCVGAAAAPSAALLSRTFADAAIARALHFSLSDAAPEPPPAPAADLATTALLHGAGAHQPSPSPSTARCRLGPAGGAGRAGKRRRPRPSRRAPTTYISTDAATFRLMVERVTGAGCPEDEPLGRQVDRAGAQGGLGGLLLPRLGVEPLAPAALDHAAHFAAAYNTPPPAALAAPTAEQPLFPTLDSWNVMYGKNQVA